MQNVEPKLPFVPVIILGAGRSGTNALRDMLTSLDGFSTWPCDEINPIWRHGNVLWPNDELPADLATSKVKRFIRKAFLAQWKRSGKPQFLVEKTCANTLRTGFVNQILPEAKYIHIVRNGFDVVSSAEKRWRGEMEVQSLPYFLKKARFIPLTDVPYFGYKFIRNRVNRVLGKSERLSYWGPIPANIAEFETEDLKSICAHQWSICVEKCDQELSKIHADQVLHVTYEQMVSDPTAVLELIMKLADTNGHDLSFSEQDIQSAVSSIRAPSQKKAPKKMPPLSDSAKTAMQVPLQRYGGVLW